MDDLGSCIINLYTRLVLLVITHTEFSLSLKLKIGLLFELLQHFRFRASDVSKPWLE